MKCELISFEHSANGLSLFVVPETDAERVLLQAMWQHGTMKVCNGMADRSGEGFAIAWKHKQEDVSP